MAQKVKKMSQQSLEDQISATYTGKRLETAALTSVVILNLDRYTDIRANIESLYQRTDLPFEVVIFDNGSKDQDAINYLKHINGKTKEDGNGKIKVIFNKENIGCSAGRKEALKHVSKDAKYIATIDNDIIYTSGWLEELIQSVEKDDKIAAAGVKLVLPDEKIQLTGGDILIEPNTYFANFTSCRNLTLFLGFANLF